MRIRIRIALQRSLDLGNASALLKPEFCSEPIHIRYRQLIKMSHFQQSFKKVPFLIFKECCFA
jgi:hypothetical protein